MKSTVVCCLLMVLGAMAAWALPSAVDGKWVAKIQTKRGARELVLNLKTDGDRLTGTIDRGSRETEIADGKLDGDQISFTTTRKGKKRTVKTFWTGRVEGSELKGTRRREDGKHGRAFKALRE